MIPCNNYVQIVQSEDICLGERKSASCVIDSSVYSEISLPANSTQQEINQALYLTAITSKLITDGLQTQIDLVDGLETKIIEGANTTITGSGTDIDPYVVSTTTVANTSELVNDGSDGTSTYIEADDLSTVATSGSYNDLVNKPYNFITITKAELDTLIANSELSVGATYEITGVDVPLYGGTTVYLKALLPNKLAEVGTGLFYTPKYDQTVPGYNIWSNYMEGEFSNIIGTFESGEDVTSNTGATAIFLVQGLLAFTSGDWSSSTTITGNVSTATADISDFIPPSYSIGDKRHWGGMTWTNLTGNVGESEDRYTLDSNWEVISFDDIEYNTSLDEILYDYSDDMILSRKDRYGNEVSGSNQWFIESASPDGNNYGNPIKDFQWGNGQENFNTDDYEYKGIQNNKVIESYFECLNFLSKYTWSNTLTDNSYIDSTTLTNNSYIQSNTLTNNSYIQSNTLTNSSYIRSNTLTNNSYIKLNTLTNYSSIDSNTLTNYSNIDSNTLTNSSYIKSNTLTNYSRIALNTLTNYSRITLNTLASSSIRIGLGNILTSKVLTLNTIENVSINMNITTGNIIFLNYLKSIYTRPDGTPKIRYYNDSDVLVIADITD